YDVILDGTDTFETRYTLNDAAVVAGIPVVHASVYRFEGQLTVFKPYEGPCYRCLYPTPPPPELAPGCSVAGVLGVVPGIMGLLQTNEVLKLLLGIGDSLAGRLLLFDALDASFTELRLRRDPDCPVCSDKAVAARNAGRPLAVAGVGDGGSFALEVRS
ncbi:MAG TPA: ThiF family adenylyltransferase, partial [Candidatus Binatia bacterium]|nr:ThiF family adenylyltransferase [Candidatus Binatia bacterium]